MNRELDAHLDGVHIGTTSMTAGGALGFRYSEQYVAGGDPTPISMSMPLDRLEHKNRVVLPFLQGLLPDNAQALASMATAFGVSAASPFALLEHVGKDVAGALQFTARGVPAPDTTQTRTDVDPLTEAEIALMLTDAMYEYRDGRPISRREGRFSLAGAQPKIALHRFDDGGWGLPRDATPTTHIFKPVSEELRRIDVIEQLTMMAAAELGLTTAQSEIVEIGGIRTSVTTRYDRENSPSGWRRLHQEDLCQALGVSPAKKYQRLDGGPGVAAVADLLEQMPVLGDRRNVALSFFTAFVFNAVVAGTDAHAKNYSLMLDGERVRLAPLYDLASYATYRIGDESVQLAMNANGKYKIDLIGTDDLVRAGMRLRIGAKEARDVVDRLRGTSLTAFERARMYFGEHGDEADEVADRLVEGIGALPLVDKT